MRLKNRANATTLFVSPIAARVQKSRMAGAGLGLNLLHVNMYDVGRYLSAGGWWLAADG